MLLQLNGITFKGTKHCRLRVCFHPLERIHHFSCSILFEKGYFCNLPYHRFRIGLYLCSSDDYIITRYRANEQNMSFSRLCTAFVHLSRSNRAFSGRTLSAIFPKCKCMIDWALSPCIRYVNDSVSRHSRHCGYRSFWCLETLTLKTCFDSFVEPLCTLCELSEQGAMRTFIYSYID